MSASIGTIEADVVLDTKDRASSNNGRVWDDLVSWVVSAASGLVHPALELREDATTTVVRGVFATRAIRQGEVLIRLPEASTVNGRAHPDRYFASTADNNVNNDERQASPWLRCLAAYLQAATSKTTTAAPYIASLPASYETLWQWSDTEISDFLAGTSPPSSVASLADSWKLDRTALRQRYREQIRPYLVHCGIMDDCQSRPPPTDDCRSSVFEKEFQQFAEACQVLSTRGFHMEANNKRTADPAASIRTGPFLLPVIDLLNHASQTTGRTCTTLQRQSAGGADMFVMVAERHVSAGEEILHSYGDHLSSSQFLSSFGFVPQHNMDRAAAAAGRARSDSSAAANGDSSPTAPVLLSKTRDLWKACWEVIESDVPQNLTASMKEQDMEDEVWSLQVDRSRTADYVPEEIMVSEATALTTTANGASNNLQDVQQLDLLTDELVTAACIPLLPRCAYSEITERTLLDRSILEDYFLGKLVGAVLLKAIEQKLRKYAPIPQEVVRSLLLAREGGTDEKVSPFDGDDSLLRQALVSMKDTGESSDVIRQQRQRLSYGLTVRIEERNTLEALRRQVVALLAILDSGSYDATAAVVVDGSSSTSKKQKTTSE